MVGLGNRAMQVPSVLFLKPDGEFLVGESAERRGVGAPDQVAREFKRRLGDRVPILIDGVPYSAQSLQATLLAWVVEQVTQRQGAPPDQITVTCPASWGAFKRRLFAETIELAEISEAQVTTEPEAVAVLYAARNTLRPTDVIGVYDLGGGTFDSAVLAKTAAGFQLLGTPEGIDHLGGIDFDEAVFQHTIGMLGDRLTSLLGNNGTAGGLARLRRDCVEAKEALSTDTETVVPVVLPGFSTSLTLTRDSFENMIGPTIADTVATMRRGIRSAGLRPSDLSAIVLSGGSSRIPLVSRLLSEAFGRPLALDTHPKHDVALGATLIDRPSPTPPAIAPPPSGRTAVALTPVSIDPSPPSPPVSVATPAERGKRRRRRPLLIGLVVVLVSAVGVAIVHQSLGSSGGTITSPLPTGTMLVTGEIDDVYTLYAVDVETGATEKVPLPASTRAGAQPFLPTISPDRKSFVYLVGDPSHALEHFPSVPWIATLNGPARPLFTDKSPCKVSDQPAFSPDGTELAVVCPNKYTGIWGLYLIGIDGTRKRLLRTDNLLVGIPSWTTDGRIIFEQRSSADSPPMLWSISLTDPKKTVTQLTMSAAGGDTVPMWSRSRGVLFLRGYSSLGPNSFWVIGLDGVVREVHASDDLHWPCWSPDGSRIAYLTSDSPPVLETMKVDGTDRRPVNWSLSLGTPGPPSWATR